MQINVGLNARANVRVGVFSPDLIENFLRGEGNALRMILVQHRQRAPYFVRHENSSFGPLVDSLHQVLPLNGVYNS